MVFLVTIVYVYTLPVPHLDSQSVLHICRKRSFPEMFLATTASPMEENLELRTPDLRCRGTCATEQKKNTWTLSKTLIKTEHFLKLHKYFPNIFIYVWTVFQHVNVFTLTFKLHIRYNHNFSNNICENSTHKNCWAAPKQTYLRIRLASSPRLIGEPSEALQKMGYHNSVPFSAYTYFFKQKCMYLKK